ncbi:MAG TPA: HAMP domain-containing sensor histidine kinase [Gemmatimonadaceae bacterium]|nr:HAMP domain-containing sensor histidine kinase [Gemmatimonadaceae bacterium]
MSGVLAVILIASLVLTYGTLVSAGEDSVRQHLGQAVNQIASSVEGSLGQRIGLLRTAARDPAMRRALAGARQRTAEAVPSLTVDSAPPPPALLEARGALAKLRTAASDSGLPAELWTADGRRLTYDGPDFPIGEPARTSAPSELHPVMRDGLIGIGATDSVEFGGLFPHGDRVLFWVVAPVLERGVPMGYVAQLRRVMGPRAGTQSLRELTGEDVEMYMRNHADSVWALAPGTPARAPTRRDSTPRGLVNVRDPGGHMIAVEARVDGTPWWVVLESPLRTVEGRAQSTLVRLATLSVLLMALGAVISWAISRRITRPLASLTMAAEAIARGEYGRRVDHVGGDEIGRLATSFNQMASEVEVAREELEMQVEEAQAAAEETEEANRHLQVATSAAERAREEAERASRAKSDFLAVMSHELRTPLNAIGGYAQLIDLGVHGPVTENQRDALARITRSQAHLLRLINDVLNFARLDAGQVQYDITNVLVDETVDSLEALVAPQVRAKRLTLTHAPCGAHVTARADREKLQQIVINLLTNAIKFTPEDGTIAMECEADDRQVRIRLRDSGVGIPEEFLRSIFDPFVQVDRALHRPNEGVGLGLAISRDLARGMGGDLTVESTVGVGSVFTLTLEIGA